MFNLKNKVIVVTGACGLLGRTYCEAIASRGGIPVILDLIQEKCEKFAKELSKKYCIDALGLAVDITKEEQITESADLVYAKFGSIDGLINNAAKNPKVENTLKDNFSRLEKFRLADWESDIAVGLTGAFLCCKHFGHKISETPNGGVIINISSDLGIIAPDQRLYRDEKLGEEEQNVKPVTYSVVKSGLIGLTRYMATYWPTKVRCNALCPGGVKVDQPEEFLRKVSKRIPMRKLASVDEYCGTIIYMLSDSSSYMNGAIISVDGGRTVW